tara:strand:+ start:250 stop:498 length:249 start_codon:yes stop_codon:yes gene_type:complete
MIKVYDTITTETEYFDNLKEAREYIKTECIYYNKYVESEEYITKHDFEIEEYFKCGFCGYEIEEESRYCSKSCNDADNTEGV